MQPSGVLPDMFAKLIGKSHDTVPDHLDRITTPREWEALSVRQGFNTAARTETAKFIVDLQAGARVYFFKASKWETHFDFIVRHVNPTVDYQRFIASEYLREDRRFVLGSVMHYQDGDHWTIELASSDTLAAERIVWLHQLLAPRLPLARDLAFRPVSPVQIDRVAGLEGRIPLLSRDAINASIEYQPVVVGQACGYLRIVRGKLDVSTLRPNDIVVADHVPEELPPVAALVTSDLQAPLAHVAVLSRNRNTPDMALRGAADRALFTSREGQLVRLVVAGQDYELLPVSLAEAEAAWAQSRPSQACTPGRDLATTGLFDHAQVATLGARATEVVGAKAAQLAELAAIPGVTVPVGFAIPFAAYAAHLHASGADAEIDALLADPDFARDAGVRGRRLAALRERIRATPMDRALRAELHARIAAFGPGRRSILRSSTNAEDLAGFNGAGLYESLPVAADAPPEVMEAVLKEVWASVWLQRAFEEREWYRIDHRAVAMGVLVQPYVADAVASGVAITGNPFKQGTPGVFINAQTMGATVTGAVANELPEQYLVGTEAGEFEVELLSRSSLAPEGGLILDDAAVVKLTRLLLTIHQRMLPAHEPQANAMDVEFVLDASGAYTIVQARPYTIVYSLDRARARPVETAWDKWLRRARKLAWRMGMRRLVASA